MPDMCLFAPVLWGLQISEEVLRTHKMQFHRIRTDRLYRKEVLQMKQVFGVQTLNINNLKGGRQNACSQ